MTLVNAVAGGDVLCVASMPEDWFYWALVFVPVLVGYLIGTAYAHFRSRRG